MKSFDGVPSTPTLNRYLEKLSITPDDLAGKRILDIGGNGLYFAREALRSFRAEVFSIDKYFSEATARYATWKWQAELYRAQSRELDALGTVLKRSVWALAQKLPFQDEVFDIVISNDTVPVLFEDYSDIFRALQEAIRVTRRGGEVRVHPLEPLWHPGAKIVKRRRTVNKTLDVLLKRQRRIRITIIPFENDDPVGSGIKIVSRLLVITKK